jgi:dinuclear metal center YbgI/SA1388 family protein
MADRDVLVRELNELLEIERIEDYCPNGLQVEGAREVTRVVAGVSASAALFEAALERGAQMVLVHHGLLWSKEIEPIVGSLRRRLKLLLANDMNLVAYHLPLDRHEELGNNALGLRALGVESLQPFGKHRGGTQIGYRGECAPVDIETLGRRVAEQFDRAPLIFAHGPAEIRSIAMVSGGAARSIDEAVEEGIDCYITGEPAEWIPQYAREEGIHFIAAGHHATERSGVQALCRWLTEHHGIEAQYVEIPNPV